MMIVRNSKCIPVISEVDLLVVGGGITGLPAAFIHAQSGKKVLVIEETTFLGYEVGIWQRPWAKVNEHNKGMAQDWFDIDVSGISQGTTTVVPIHMDRYKRRLEDKLFEAGVDILYGCQVVACYKKAEGWQVVIGNKSGRLVINACRLIDSTETSIISRLIGDNEYLFMRKEMLQSGEGTVVRRTLEFIQVDGELENSYTLPEELGVFKNCIDLYKGAFSDNHVIVDIPIELKEQQEFSPVQSVKLEYMARKKSLEVGSYLVNNIPAFSRAKLGTGSLTVMRSEEFDLMDTLSFSIEAGCKIFKDKASEQRCVILGYDWLQGLNRVKSSVLEAETQGEFLIYAEETDFNKFHRLPEIEIEENEIPVLIETEVLVVGGGTTGAVAARAAAEEGAKTALVEMNTALGGTGTVGGVHYYWYGYRNAFTGQIDRLVEEWAKKLSYPEEEYYFGTKDSWSIELKAFVFLDMCIAAGVNVFFNCLTIGTLIDENKVKGVVIATPYGTYAVKGKVIIDATGDGDVAAFAGADFIYGNERDRMAMWSSFAQYKAPGQYQGGNFATTMDAGDILDYNRFIKVGRRRGGNHLYDHGTYVTPRESRHIRGEYTITLMDQLLMRRYHDTISLCFSNHDPKGRSSADIIYFGIIPPHLEIEIPYRALLPVKLDQILITGRAISSTHDGLAAIRMQDDFQQQGGAAGVAAALSIKNDVRPRDLEVKMLQKRLVEIGTIRPEMAGYECQEVKPDYNGIIEGLTGEEAFEWLEMDLDKKADEVSPVVNVCAAEREEVIDILLSAFDTSEGKRKLLLARLLLWHGHEAGLDVLISEILDMLDEEDTLPSRKASIRWCQLYPDHGVMTEVTYLINLLSRVKSKKVVAVFEKLAGKIAIDERNYRDMRKCIFNYIESIAYCAERLAFSEFKPILAKLLELPELKNRVRKDDIEVDLVGERLAYLVICLSRALARCGSKKGMLKLVEFVEDNRLLLAKSAYDELRILTNLDFGKSAEKWTRALENWPDDFKAIPWTLKMY